MTKPDKRDIRAIEREFGKLPNSATEAQIAHRYRLAQAAKLIRIYHLRGRGQRGSPVFLTATRLVE
jgi:hypothetical protein